MNTSLWVNSVAERVNGVKLEQITEFRYSRSTITADNRCAKKICIRIAKAKEEWLNSLSRQLKKAIKVCAWWVIVWRWNIMAKQRWHQILDRPRSCRIVDLETNGEDEVDGTGNERRSITMCTWKETIDAHNQSVTSTLDCTCSQHVCYSEVL